MAGVVKNRGAGGEGSIVFRQNLEYPREPGQITYYPPEPSDELKKQIRKDRAGGIMLYVIGFALVLIGYIAYTSFSDNGLETYSLLIMLLLILGIVFAVMFLFMNNKFYAKLSATLPLILLVCLLLLYISGILMSVMDLTQLGDGSTEQDLNNAFEGLTDSLLNPGFFMMTTGLMICRAGGNSLLMSTKVMDLFIPGMIIIETPYGQPAPAYNAAQPVQAPQPVQASQERLCEHCGQPLSYVEEYQRYYCYDCQEYAPKDA